MDVFGLTLPKYLECDLFPESPDPNICIGQAEVKAVKFRESKPSKWMVKLASLFWEHLELWHRILLDNFQSNLMQCIKKVLPDMLS